MNGTQVTRSVAARQHLVDFLREELGLTGSHIGCEHGVCGACTLRVNGDIVRGCLMLAVQADGCRVDTIEGLSDSKELEKLQKAFHEKNALQCGFCTPGMLMAAQDLVRMRKEVLQRRNTKPHLRQLLPLHGLPGDRRCHRRGDQWVRQSSALHAPGTQVDKGYIGQSVPRANAQRLLQGRGAFTDDLRFPRLAHVAFFRSPYAHARIKRLDFKGIETTRVIGVFDGRAVAEYCKPWVAVLAHLKGIKSPPQHAIAIDRVLAGRACAAVVAESRSQAEDAVQLIEAEWEELPVVVDMEASLKGDVVIHEDLKDNICFKREHDTGGVDEVFAKADVVVEDTFHFGRHTGVCPRARDPRRLQRRRAFAHRVPRDAGAAHDAGHLLAPPRHSRGERAGDREGRGRLLRHQGARLRRRDGHGRALRDAAPAGEVRRRPARIVPVRYPCREHRARVRLACKSGEILAFDLDDLTAIGPYSVYPRTSGIEGNQVVNLTGGRTSTRSTRRACTSCSRTRT